MLLREELQQTGAAGNTVEEEPYGSAGILQKSAHAHRRGVLVPVPRLTRTDGPQELGLSIAILAQWLINDIV